MIVVYDPQTGAKVNLTPNASQGALLSQVLIELRVMTQLLHAAIAPGLMTEELEALRLNVINENQTVTSTT